MSQAFFISHDNPVSGEFNTSQFRVHLPRQALSAAGHDITHQNTPPQKRNGRFWVDGVDHNQLRDVVLLERFLSHERAERLRLSGVKRIVLTFDDNYTMLPRYSSVWSYWGAHLQEWLRALPLADEIIVPSHTLVDDFYSYNPRIRYVPNYHDGALWDVPVDIPARPVIGWGGSMQHLQSWELSGILPALSAVLRDFPEWELVVCGSIEHFLRDRNIPYRGISWQPLLGWAATVKTFTIGLAPLHGPYDARRSNLKVVEYGLAGVPFVASESSPYRLDPSPGGVLVRRGKWEEALRHYMTDETARRQAAEAGRAWAQNYTLEKSVPVYEQVLWP